MAGVFPIGLVPCCGLPLRWKCIDQIMSRFLNSKSSGDVVDGIDCWVEPDPRADPAVRIVLEPPCRRSRWKGLREEFGLSIDQDGTDWGEDQGFLESVVCAEGFIDITHQAE